MLTLLFFVCASLTAATTRTSIDGVWQEKIHIGGEDDRVVLRIGSQANGLLGTLDSPDTGKLGIPLASLKAEEDSIAFELSDPRVLFKGTLSDGKLIGQWKQNDQTVPLTLFQLAKAPEFDKDGSYLFHSQCSGCHAPFNAMRAPWPTTLKLMTQTVILSSLEGGKMSAVGSAISYEQRVAVATYLGRSQVAQQVGQANMCATAAPPMKNSPLWNEWGVDLSNSHFQSAELAGLNKSQLPRLRLKWAFGFLGGTSAGGPPTIIGDRIFVAGGDGRIYSLNLDSGCVYWTFLPMAPAHRHYS
jgi:hypothetical protein